MVANISKLSVFLDQKIPVRDGIHLSSTIIIPQSKHSKTFPVLLLITPYNADRNYPQAKFFAQNDYVVVLVDSRGRGNSDGIAEPFSSTDGKDGYDVCNWIGKQKWCNGKIGMFGGSYLGMVQWLTLKENPSLLKTIIPTASVCPGIDFPMRNNIFYTYLAPYFSFIYGKTTNTNFFTDDDYWNEFYSEYYAGRYPFKELLNKANIQFDKFNEWIGHPYFDNYWKSILPSPEDFKRMNIPILTITGYFDDDQSGALYYYTEHLRFNSEFAKNNHYLVIGPWDHQGTRAPNQNIGNLKFNELSLLNINELHLKWFDWILKGKNKPEILKNKILLYSMGDEKWCDFDSLIPDKPSVTTYYLNNDTDNKTEINLSKKIQSHTDLVVFNLSPDTIIPFKFFNSQSSSFNYAYFPIEFIENIDYLKFSTLPLNKKIKICGKPILKLFIETDVCDTDLLAIIYEKTHAGKMIYLTSDVLRSRYAESIEYQKLMKKNEKIIITLNSFYFFFREIQKNSTLELYIVHLNCPFYQKNYQSGMDISSETIVQCKSGKLNIYFGKLYPSQLQLTLF